MAPQSPADSDPSGPASRAARRSSSRGDRIGALRYRNYRLFFVGQLASVVGMWMQGLALSWFVVADLGGSPFDLGLVNVFQFAPVLLLGLVGGVIADRFNKRDLVNVTQVVAGTLAAAQAALILSGNASLIQVYSFALILGISNAVNMPARQALTSELVDKPDLMNAIALNSALFNTGRVIGPALAGLLVAALGPAICFIINAVAYLIGIMLFRQMRFEPVQRATKDSGLQRIAQGLRFVRNSQAVLLPIVLVGLVATFAMNFNVWLPLLSRDDFGVGAGGFGVLMSALGAGSLVGALGLAFIGGRPRWEAMVACAGLLGVLEVILAVTSAIPLSVVIAVPLLAGAGFCMTTAMTTANTLVQSAAPDDMRGRVMSVYMTVFAGTVPFGALITGALANAVGTPLTVAFGGIIATVSAGGVWLLQRRWTTTAAPITMNGSASGRAKSAPGYASSDGNED